jgi:hypothetical protein
MRVTLHRFLLGRRPHMAALGKEIRYLGMVRGGVKTDLACAFHMALQEESQFKTPDSSAASERSTADRLASRHFCAAFSDLI